MNYRHDTDADAVYIRLSEAKYAYGEELDPERRVDYAADGTPVGVELLCVSTGVDVTDLPDRDSITRVLSEHKIPILTS